MVKFGFIQTFILMKLLLLITSCNQIGTATFEGAAILVEAPLSITLISPLTSPSLVATPKVKISGNISDHVVTLYQDANCTQQIGQVSASGNSVEITTSSLADGTYQFAVRSYIDGTLSPCSGALLEYIKGAGGGGGNLTFGSWITPATNSGDVSIISFSVTGATGTETVSVYTDSNCTGSVIGSAAAVGGTATITSSALAIGAATEFNLYAKGSVSTSCSNLNQKYTFSCPTGYIRVPSNTSLGTTNDFCVMKYEAKSGPSNNAISESAGNPIVSFKVGDSQAKCTNNGAKYDLISNPEWMTIARNAESVSSNFQAGVFARGWAARSDYGDSWSNTAVATSTDSSCLYNTGADTCGSTGSHLYKRTLNLSNGEIIWDLSGNVYEWVDWDLSSAGVQTGSINCASSWVEFPTLISNDPCFGNSLFAKDVIPFTANGSSVEGFGRFFGSNGGIAKRGGAWDGGWYSGAYTLILQPTAADYDPHVGFRCVYRPYE